MPYKRKDKSFTTRQCHPSRAVHCAGQVLGKSTEDYVRELVGKRATQSHPNPEWTVPTLPDAHDLFLGSYTAHLLSENN